jgi:hypothetical protein
MTAVATTQIRTFESAEALAQNVAKWLCGVAQASDRDFPICLSGGATPRRRRPTLRRVFRGPASIGFGVTSGSFRMMIPTATI